MAKDPIKTLEEMISGLEGKVTEVVRKHSVRLWRITVQQHMAGPTSSTSVSKRTGTLARGVSAEEPKSIGGVITGGIKIASKYARTHIGPKGSSVIIKPKTKQFLAIPLQAAKTAAGVARGGPRSGIFGPTFIAKGIIFGYSGGTKKSTGGHIIPLFVLKKQVIIPRRIDPRLDLLKKIEKGFKEDLKQAIKPGSA